MSYPPGGTPPQPPQPPGPPPSPPPPRPGPRYRRLSPLTPLVRSSLVFVAVLGGTWQSLAEGRFGMTALILIGVLVAGAVYGAASWWLTKYWIEGDELRVDTGVLNRQSRRIRIDRLQGIDIVQPFVARLFGLAELRMDVAGGGKAEGSLAFVPLAEARDLKELLLARRDARRRAITPQTPLEDLPPPHPERLLARLDLAILLVSLLLSWETVAVVVAAGATIVLAVVSGSVGVAFGMLPVVGGFAVVVARRAVGFYGFGVSDTAAGLQVSRGLFELTSQTIAPHRIQGVVVTEPLLWRRFGWARLDVSVAGYTSGDADAKELSSTLLPVGPRDVVHRLAEHALRGLDFTVVPLTPPPRRARWVEPIGRFFAFAGFDDRLVVSRTGWLTRRTHVVPHRRIQSLRLSQGPWLRALNLAGLAVDSPPGPVQVRLPFRDQGEARQWLERLVELSRQARGAAPPTPAPETTQ